MSQILEIMRMGERIAELESKVKDLVCEVGAKNEVIEQANGIINKLLKFIRREENFSTYILEEAENFLKESE